MSGRPMQFESREPGRYIAAAVWVLAAAGRLRLVPNLTAFVYVWQKCVLGRSMLHSYQTGADDPAPRLPTASEAAGGGPRTPRHD